MPRQCHNRISELGLARLRTVRSSILRPCWQMLCLLVLGCGGGAQGWEDGFDGPSRGARWQCRVPVPGPPLSLSDRPGWLRVRVPERAAGFNHWNAPQPVDGAPQLRVAGPEGDWEPGAPVQVQQVAARRHGAVAGPGGRCGGERLAVGAAYRVVSDAHNQWPNVRAEKQGRTIHLWEGDQCTLSWEDPEPLPGGRLGIWTTDNAIMVPRVAIHHWS